MEVLLEGFALGAVGGIVPGAVLTILLLSALHGDFQRAIQAFFWAIFSEVVIAGGLLFIATRLPLEPRIFSLVGFVGGIVLLYFAWRVFHVHSLRIAGAPVLFSGPKIFLLSASNAPLYIFWTTVCFPLIWELSLTWGLPLAAISYFAAFEIGWAITTFIMLLLFIYSRKVLMEERIMGKVFIVVGLVMAGLGVDMLWQGAKTALLLLNS